MKLNDLTILLVSNEPWGDVWFSKHHYAAELAVRNRVLFLDPPLRWDSRAFFNSRFRRTAIFPGLSVVRYFNPLPRAVALPTFSLNALLVERRLEAFLRQSRCSPDLILTFDPFRPFSPRALRAQREIYYIVDDFQTRRERAVLRMADTLLAVSPELAVRHQDERRRLAHVIPHGVRDHGIGEDALVNPTSTREIICCANFNARTDFEILLAVARRFPGSVLRLIGPVSGELSQQDHARVSALRELSNVVFAGVKPYAEMSRDIAAAAVGICVYKKPRSLADASSSLKTIQYLSFGKPVVSTTVRYYTKLDPRFVRTADDETEFVKALQEVLSEPHDPDLIRARIAFTKDVSYAKLLERIEEILD